MKETKAKETDMFQSDCCWVLWMKGELWKEDGSADASVLSTAVFSASDGGSGWPGLDVRLCRLHFADVQTGEMPYFVFSADIKMRDFDCINSA